MVKLEEVEDEAFIAPQPGVDEEGDWDTDSGMFTVQVWPASYFSPRATFSISLSLQTAN